MAGIKTFAQEARRNLMHGVLQRLEKWGFDGEGNVLEEVEKVSGGYFFRGQVYDDQTVYAKWQALKSAIANKGIETVVEEGAYTWFNRMMAIRILSKNGYIPKQLEYVSAEAKTPQLLANARRGQYSFLTNDEQTRLAGMLTDYSKDQEAFALLLTGYCHSHNTLNRVFGKLDDYTELLLPDNMLQDGGFLHLLNTTDAISAEDYQTVELIGWLYQFYISEKKGEVFASFKKNKKAEAKDIPAATQIFTPNWIVKYMVENTAGKIWLDKYPDSPLKEKMKYLVENNSSPSEGEVPKAEGLITEVEDLTLIDPACGSGHILVEGFDLIYQMYMEEFVPAEQAVQSIFEKNLFGLDIDVRAAQLATFAILLKAAKVYPDVWTKDWLPQVYAMPEAQNFSQQELKDFLGAEGEDYLEELDDALRLMKQAKNLGSVMKLKLSAEAQTYIAQRFKELKTAAYRDFNVEAVYQSIQTYIPVLLLLTKKYSSVVANPPYMGSGNMNADLKNYVNANYPLTKSDLFAVFMETCLDLNVKKGLMGMINQHAWMFLSSYKKLRNHLLENYGIVHMLHLGPRTFEELSGEVVQSTAFVLENGNEIENATYYRLIDYKTVHEKESAFLEIKNEHRNIPQNNFTKIPGSPIAYWVSSNVGDLFQNEMPFDTYFETRIGLVTGDNNYYIKNWFEVSQSRCYFNCFSQEESKNSNKKWYPQIKGGESRKWYGNYLTVINWYNDGHELKNRMHSSGSRLLAHNFNSEYQLSIEGLTWTKISSKSFSVRLQEKGFVFNDASASAFPEVNGKLFYTIAFLNSKVAANILKVVNATLNILPGNVGKIPLNFKNEAKIEELTSDALDLSKQDWDSRETSWDFKQSPLFNETPSLEQAYQSWQEKVTQDFFELHTNEEELNRIFINIYGLQDELTPEVALKDITILQEELAKKDMEALEETFRTQGKEATSLPIDRSEVISQFISYAIGLFMGRYRLDKPGLNIAHPNPSAEELASYTHNGGQVIIDEDAIVPIMGRDCTFTDDAYYQVQDLLHTIWGADTLTDNINFIEECLDKDLEKYLVKDFWKDHSQRYKEKPIYWLFSSPKGAFQVLVYMHRMNRFTLEKIRSEYLLPHMKHLRNQVEQLESSGANPKREEQLSNQLLECQDYDLLMKDMADRQIEFDLDDGVTENYKMFESVVAKVK